MTRAQETPWPVVRQRRLSPGFETIDRCNQTYYAIAGEQNSLESDQLRIALTKLDAESGSFITFLTQGEGRQVLLTEVFGGQAEAIVETSRFLEGELVYQGSSLELATATGYVSTNSGWQIGLHRLLHLKQIIDQTRAGTFERRCFL